MKIPYKTALIIGAGSGISASLARRLAVHGIQVGLAARNTAKLDALASETRALTFPVEASDPLSVGNLFKKVERRLGPPDIVVYNAGARAQGPVSEIDPAAVRQALLVNAFGAFLAVQEAARRMIPRSFGAILMTGATASLKGFSHSAAFAMGKFALRGLAQSTARELGPKGIHVAHFVIDGVVRIEDELERSDSTLSPDGIAQTYWNVLMQPRDAWTLELELRPWVERF